MENSQYNIPALKDFFLSGATQTIDFRKQQLIALQKSIFKYENELNEALFNDLKKSKEEVWVTEIGFVLSELNLTLKKIDKWCKPQKVSTNLLNFPSASYIQCEPLGTVLIIAPWNYPFQLLFTPLIGAIAAGNCIVLKPSEFAIATQGIIKKIIEETFTPNYILFTEGEGATIVPQLTNNFIFDHIFYTGSTAVGKIIYQQAAKNLVPVTLELGGKSPCVVDVEANVEIAAKRIAVTKFSNCGQMCVAPDYILVHSSIKAQLVAFLIKCINDFFGTNAEDNSSYGKIINHKQLERLVSYLTEGKIVYGGNYNLETLYLQPTIIENINPDSNLLVDEIFGPILPIITYNNNQEALNFISKNPNPLAFYIFSNNKHTQNFWLQKVPSGGACVNNTSWHLTNHNLPFGGRGNSGIGNYHGNFSFKTFSHSKAVLKTPTWFDPSIKYPPFKGKLGLFKKLIG